MYLYWKAILNHLRQYGMAMVGIGGLLYRNITAIAITNGSSALWAYCLKVFRRWVIRLAVKKIGGSVFSADGSLYARTNNCGAVVCHFDRCSGLFSNPIFMERPGGDYGDGGLAFSDNNRWLYATSNLCIFRAGPHFRYSIP